MEDSVGMLRQLLLFSYYVILAHFHIISSAGQLVPFMVAQGSRELKIGNQKLSFFFFLTKSFLNVYVKNWSIILCGHGLHKSSSYGRLVHLERATFGDKLPQSATSGTLPLVSNSLSTFLGYFCNKDLR